MRFIVMANGKYGDLSFYNQYLTGQETILCADGGANHAYKMGVVPQIIIGDMDSIFPEVKEYFVKRKVTFKKFPRRKDFTDTQLVLTKAAEMGASEIILLGTLGRRLDHTLSNLYGGIEMAQRGIKISHLSPRLAVYLVSKELEIIGQAGDLVSVLSLTEQAHGVTVQGFDYPLDQVVLEQKVPYAISNVLSGNRGMISVDEGILAVFHYFQEGGN
ncbi:Thiamin pyrophosphokinase [Syntrophomonas zehnderi OL-4]|uniref:Thiamine diphosphokinase n=1 Tax=Syntrophomonas zehnderi OL-4 TaxID=690567 RepID=A0A0E4C961_9FIRM|nr:thiamine diphosphokinase [Syntrophomonas zehnderi]CFX84538.1 Thiamin pyrophosphokinase [Syntrophomonas zehnderi OL-4]